MCNETLVVVSEKVILKRSGQFGYEILQAVLAIHYAYYLIH